MALTTDNPTLIVIDVQRAFDNPGWGARNNPDAEQHIASLLSAWRRDDAPILHIRHRSITPTGPFQGDGFQFKDAVLPAPNEPIIENRRSASSPAFSDVGRDPSRTSEEHASRTAGTQIDNPRTWSWSDMNKINFNDKLGLITDTYRPRTIARYNENDIKLCRARGEFVWHKHDDTDDLFVVLKGRLVIQLRDRDIELREGELFVVPRGVEHCPRADDEAEVLLIEPTGTVNTGDAPTGELTAEPQSI